MFITALFTIVKPWKQAKCPSADEWISKMWCMYQWTIIQPQKKKEILMSVTTWVDLEGICQEVGRER